MSTPEARRLSSTEIAGLSASLQDPIEYRKSGLSLNHIIGCPLDCSYCVRHLFGNFGMKTPSALMSDETAVARLIAHRFFVPDVTPLQLFNRATDPFLPAVKPHLFATLENLDQRGLKNHVLVITRYKIAESDCIRLNKLSNLRLTILVTYSGIADQRLEPIDSNIALESLRTAYAAADRYRVILYWRPIIPGINDSDEHIRKAKTASRNAHAVVFTGLFYRNEIREYYSRNGLSDLYPEIARRKILPRFLEQRIIESFRASGLIGTLFRKTSCGVAFAHKVPDYNGHYGIREICDICPSAQVRLCAEDHLEPPRGDIDSMVKQLGGDCCTEITDRSIVVRNLDEQRRYFIQHKYRYQVHDLLLPHQLGHHGRAEIGWGK